MHCMFDLHVLFSGALEAIMHWLGRKGWNRGRRKWEVLLPLPPPWPQSQDSLVELCRHAEVAKHGTDPQHCHQEWEGGMLGWRPKRKGDPGALFTLENFLQSKIQILHSGHIWYYFTWNYVLAFHARRSGPAQLGNSTRATRYQGRWKELSIGGADCERKVWAGKFWESLCADIHQPEVLWWRIPRPRLEIRIRVSDSYLRLGIRF